MHAPRYIPCKTISTTGCRIAHADHSRTVASCFLRGKLEAPDPSKGKFEARAKEMASV